MKNKKIKILMVSSEIAPFSKVGGLGDVLGSLPKSLINLNCEIIVITPFYKTIDIAKYNLKKISQKIIIRTNGQNELINIYNSLLPDTKIKVYFIENKNYFNHEEIYGKNNSKKFLFFSLATLNILPIIKFKPDIIHCHDFHTAFIPVILKSEKNKYKNIKTLFTIHNLKFQGISNLNILKIVNLKTDSLPSLKKDAADNYINFMAEGLINSDLINTVSPTYADEIKSNQFGYGLEKIIKLNNKKISGILNGIDDNFYNPAKDKFIKKNYSLKNLYDKNINKYTLQKKLGLIQNKNIALSSMITRLDSQKGINLFTENFLKLNSQYVILGTGNKEIEKNLILLAKKYSKKLKVIIKFDEKLAHYIYAASDIFLMPSKFEPCGLGQMIAMKYGAIPVVRKTGGLNDTVNEKVGYKFKNFSSDSFYQTLNKALNDYYNNPNKWILMQKNAMKFDFSWDKSALKYYKLYNKLINKN